MSALRLFLAIDIPPHARETIATIQSRFKNLGLKASWVQPGNIHLTLKFLGDTPPERVAYIKKSGSEAVRTIPVFEAVLDGIGVFPNYKKPRVLWVGLKAHGNHLEILQENIDTQMGQLGYPREKKKFNPHLTMARLKQGKGRSRESFAGLQKEIESSPSIKAEPFQVNSVKLIQSELTPKGSIYTVLQEFPLGKNNQA